MYKRQPALASRASASRTACACRPTAHASATAAAPSRRPHASASPAAAGPLAERLSQLSRDLPEREYRALLEGVAIGQRAARAARSPELARMLADFASELQKLDEGLRLLTAFLSRLREQTLEPARTLH